MADAAPGPPRTHAERVTAEAWQEVLGPRDIDRTDNFFLLGGKSRTALAVAGSLAGRIGTRVPLRLVFEYSDLCAFAEQLRLRGYVTDADEDEADRQKGRTP